MADEFIEGPFKTPTLFKYTMRSIALWKSGETYAMNDISQAHAPHCVLLGGI